MAGSHSVDKHGMGSSGGDNSFREIDADPLVCCLCPCTPMWVQCAFCPCSPMWVQCAYCPCSPMRAVFRSLWT